MCFHSFQIFAGGRVGRARPTGSWLGHPSGEAALAADLITAFLGFTEGEPVTFEKEELGCIFVELL